MNLSGASQPQAIAGSDVSIASTVSHSGNSGNANEFFRMSRMKNATSPPPSQTFATATWKPKEPPCFFGRSVEDSHTWVSLVRNYLTFMSGSDLQQVAYTATLF